MQKRSEGLGFGTIARSMGMARSTVQTIVKRESTVGIGVAS